ncbi:DEAD-box ATP-dependent RNA helicase 42-like [Harpegnathos saltator]|uniref:DEAD-box ATP-dependent RNA helicase 42-like n=1 Tax=Harpegnathos saltator TaxID=610380 RepID=UPI000DBEECF2|nr:DEAD-box ATP-dependent RNA helicase 42-like [Harpegnathos saltator]
MSRNKRNSSTTVATAAASEDMWTNIDRYISQHTKREEDDRYLLSKDNISGKRRDNRDDVGNDREGTDSEQKQRQIERKKRRVFLLNDDDDDDDDDDNEEENDNEEQNGNEKRKQGNARGRKSYHRPSVSYKRAVVDNSHDYGDNDDTIDDRNDKKIEKRRRSPPVRIPNKRGDRTERDRSPVRNIRGRATTERIVEKSERTMERLERVRPVGNSVDNDGGVGGSNDGAAATDDQRGGGGGGGGEKLDTVRRCRCRYQTNLEQFGQYVELDEHETQE